MPVSGRVVAELKNSNGPSKPQEDFQTLKWLKILLEKGAWEGSCGTKTATNRTSPGRIYRRESGEKCSQMRGLGRGVAVLK